MKRFENLTELFLDILAFQKNEFSDFFPDQQTRIARKEHPAFGVGDGYQFIVRESVGIEHVKSRYAKPFRQPAQHHISHKPEICDLMPTH